jgi:pyruvate dehydrogenase E2 component (dihydrolipoamide acetyltransferase)
MLITIRMPQMGVSDESAILSRWLVCEGDRIRPGQPVFSLETDKATFQYEAESDGFLVRILTAEGEEAAVGSPVGIMSGPEKDFSEAELEELLNKLKTPEGEKQVQIESETGRRREGDTEPAERTISVPGEQGTTRKISPRAKKKANELDLDLKDLPPGSGPGGRILERDVLNAARGDYASKRQKNAAGIYPGRPLTPDDRVGTRVIEADKAGRVGFVSRQIDARKIMSGCKTPGGSTPLAVICHALARFLARNPELNVRRHGDRIYEYGTAHLRLNVETPSCTLKPVIRCAEAYTPDELAVLMRNAAGRCRRFDVKPQELLDGTFTVSDLSGYGIDLFMPELTPPELCALGIGAPTRQTRTNEQGGIEAYPAIRLTLAYELAAIDALQAAKFLDRLAALLEPDAAQK